MQDLASPLRLLLLLLLVVVVVTAVAPGVARMTVNRHQIP